MSTWQKSSILKFLKKPPRRNSAAVFGLLIIILAVCFAGALLLGPTRVSPAQAFAAAAAGDFSNADYRIFFHIRAPRAVAAALAGAALAVSGAIIQSVLNNPMAAPNIIGVNAGAGLAVTLAAALAPAAAAVQAGAAFAGALGACLLIWAIASKTGASRLTITLVGIAVGSILAAVTNTVKSFFPDAIYATHDFSVGGFDGVGWDALSPACWAIAAALVIACLMGRSMDVLALGEDTAASLGMNVKLRRLVLLVLASVLAGCAVSFAGLLGFVGLLGPHIARRFVGDIHRRLIPFSALGGAALVLLCDLIGRVIFPPYELAAGIILSLVGGPFFLALILLQRKRKLYDKG